MSGYGFQVPCEACGAQAHQSCEPWCPEWSKSETMPLGEPGTYCEACFEDWDHCICKPADPMCKCEPMKRFYCAPCGVSRATESDLWDWIKSYPAEGFTKPLEAYKPDRHWWETVTFPDGSQVIASSHGQRTAGDPLPDFALYLDDCWLPRSLCMYLPWQDYGLPTIDLDRAVWSIEHAWDWIKNGNRVEVGCIGGHGRTGTVLACLAVLGGVPGKDAVEWVRTNYCRKAVETARQEWFVLYFEAIHNGTTPPPEPVYQPVKKYVKQSDGTWVVAGSPEPALPGMSDADWDEVDEWLETTKELETNPDRAIAERALEELEKGTDGADIAAMVNRHYGIGA